MTAPPIPRWDGRRVLVLGAGGFIGRWTARALADAGAEIHAVERDAAATRRVLADLGVAAEVRAADLSVEGAGARAVADVAPEVVFNLAGYGVRPEERDEQLLRRLNTDLVRELGEALASRGAPADGRPVLVHTGSGGEYGSAGGALDEEGPARPGSPYGRTKLAGTKALRRLGAERGLRAVVARPFTVYGPGEAPGRLLPTLIEAARTGRGADLSAGTQRRDFVHVEDVAEGLLRLGSVPAPPGLVVNLATGILLAVRDFAAEAGRVLGMPREALRFGAVPSTREEMEHDPVTTERLFRHLGWRPSTPVAEGVRRTLLRLGPPTPPPGASR